MAYVYFIKNKITNQFYYGSRSVSGSPTKDLWIHYFTSSKYVKQLIDEHGQDSFECNVIFEYDDYDICYWYEQLLIKETVKNLLSLNKFYIDPDSSMKCFHSVGISRPCSEETKQKLSEICIQYFSIEENRIAQGERQKQYLSIEENRIAHSERIKNLWASGILSREYTDEDKAIISRRMTEHMSNDAVRQKLREKRLEFLSDPINKEENLKHITALNKSRIGIKLSDEHRAKIVTASYNRQPMSQETKDKISATNKNKPRPDPVICPHCGKSGHPCIMSRWHFNNCKFKAK